MLKEKIVKLIKEQGSIPFDTFMSLALAEETEGYYKSNNPIGFCGDFTTSPEISQVFGELIGLWLLDVWLKLGSPKKCFLVELGAGRGTLLLDILRATKLVKEFHDALHIEIIEINKDLIKIQKEELKNYKNISWKTSINDLKIDAPVLIYSNEFFDALPVKQFLIKEEATFELMIGLNEQDGSLCPNFIKVGSSAFLKNIENISKNNVIKKEIIYETSPIASNTFYSLAKIVEENTGVMLTIDYGYSKPEFRNTIRGFKNHTLLSLFEIINKVGEVDFTYNVNFLELLESVKTLKIDKYNIITQQHFLENLGVHERAAVLLNNITKETDKINFSQRVETLVSSKQMGEVFKVLCVSCNVPNIAVFTKD